MIRDATHDDIPRLVEYGRAFHAESGYGHIADFDPDTFAELLAGLIDSPSGFLAVAHGGFLGGVLSPIFFNRSASMVQELFWFMEPAARGYGDGVALLERFEAWGRENGAAATLMLNIEGLPAVRRLYEARGYVPNEQSWLRAN